MSFRAMPKDPGNGQNVGASDRGKVWSPRYRMSMRAVNRSSMGGARSNRSPMDDIESRKVSKSGVPSGPRR